ncbi:MAG: hypothetical protein WBP70_15380 [Terriglobales bacterium]
MKKSLKFPSLLLLAAAALLCPRSISAQKSSEIPASMLQCEPDSCGTWSFQGKQGTGKWQTGPVATLIVERFDAGGISIRREDTSGPGKGIKGLYTGVRKGDRIEGRFTWVWPGGLYPSGTVDWYATIMTPGTMDTASPAVVVNTAGGGAGTPHHIEIPPEASEAFANFPDDVRAILQPESALTPDEAKMPCDRSSKMSAEDALEIGKFAYRAADFKRGYCWIDHSADMGNVHALVLLGVSCMMGWGWAKDPKVAYNFFLLSNSKNDRWGDYFLQQAYEKGIGTPVNKDLANRLNARLLISPDGQDIFMAIGADDIEKVRQYQRDMVLLHPPMTERKYCRAGHSDECSTEMVVDQQAVDNRLSQIDAQAHDRVNQ